MSFLQVTLKLLEGFGTTCKIFGLTLVFSIPLGLLLSFGSLSRFKPLKYLTKTFVWIIRGTPLMLQILVIFFGPGLLVGKLDPSVAAQPFWSYVASLVQSPNYRFNSAIVAFVINYAAYFSEIYRGGIESIPHGQTEAGLVLGMTKTQVFFRVVLMQVIKRIVPPMSNEIITLVKDTSLVRIISIAEIIKGAQDLAKMGYIWPLFYTGVFYLAFSGLLTLLFGFIEKKMDYYKV